jgi:hypothetical protein
VKDVEDDPFLATLEAHGLVTVKTPTSNRRSALLNELRALPQPKVPDPNGDVAEGIKQGVQHALDWLERNRVELSEGGITIHNGKGPLLTL